MKRIRGFIKNRSNLTIKATCSARQRTTGNRKCRTSLDKTYIRFQELGDAERSRKRLDNRLERNEEVLKTSLSEMEEQLQEWLLADMKKLFMLNQRFFLKKKLKSLWYCDGMIFLLHNVLKSFNFAAGSVFHQKLIFVSTLKLVRVSFSIYSYFALLVTISSEPIIA